MLSIDEAISHAREVANEQKRRSGICVQNDLECDKFSSCLKCAEEHEQITEWLEELKVLYNKAIDDCIKALKERRNERYMQVNCDDVELKILAKQLKAGERE